MTNTLTSTVLAWLLTYGIHSTVLLGLAWVVTRLRRDPATNDILWKAAILGGLLTATIQLRLDVRPSGTLTLPSVAAATTPPAPVAEPSPSARVDVAGPQSLTDPVPRQAQPQVVGGKSSTNDAPVASRLTADVVLVALWASVALLLAVGYGARRLILVGRLTERQPLTDGPLPAMLSSLCEAVGYRGRVVLTSARTISSPVALGMAEICLPEAALTDLHPELQRSMLAHELAHLSRRDPLWLDMASLIERCFFFQPLNHLARREMQTAAEFLCDDWAARRTGSGIPLARCLAKVAEWIQASPLGVPVSGMAEQRSMLVSRISRLIEGGSPGAPTPRRGAAVVALLALGATIAIAPGVSGRVKQQRLDAVDASEKQVADESGPGRRPKISSAELAKTTRQATKEVTRMHVDVRGITAKVAGLIGIGDKGTPSDQSRHLGGDTTVVNALIARLKDDDAQVRAAAARSLGRLEDTRAVPGLIVALRDSDAKVRAVAADALAQFEDPRAIAPLIALLADGNAEVKQQALDALGNFDKGVPAAPVARLLDDADADVRHQAAHLLGRIGDRASVGALAKLVRDPSVDVRQAAIEALGDLNDPAAGSAVLPALSDGSADVRQQALQTLEELKVAISEGTLRTLLNDSNADVRGSAAEIVGERSIVALVPLLQKLMQDPSANVREQAIDALSNMADQSARDALRAGLNSSDAKVRRLAAEALGERP